MLWRACDQPSNKVLPNCQEASQRQQFLLSQHFHLPASHGSSVHPATQSVTKPGNDLTRVRYKRREVDLVPLDAIQVVTVQVKAAIENGCLARLWEKGWLLIWLSLTCLCEKGWFFPKKNDEFSQRYLDHFWHLNSDARVSRSSCNQIFFKWLSTIQ